MARIRTLKPDFWTDEKIVQLPYVARLLFIGSFNFADDEGYLVDEPERLRLQVLPGDRDVDVDALLDLLVAAGLIDRLENEDGTTLLRVAHFDRHQRVSHAAESRLKSDTYRKTGVSNAGRRAVATKYGCEPGEEKKATCYYCGAQGLITWWRNYSNGKPSAWVSFTDLEVDHFEPEKAGGRDDSDNLVLACRPCNRAKKDKPAGDYFANPREGSRALRPELNGIEGNRKTISASGNLQSPRESSGGMTRYEEVTDAVSTVCQLDPERMTRTGKRSFDVAVADLVKVGATSDDVIERAMQYRQAWPDASLTPSALARRWSEIEAALQTAQPNNVVLANFARSGSDAS